MQVALQLLERGAKVGVPQIRAHDQSLGQAQPSLKGHTATPPDPPVQVDALDSYGRTPLDAARLKTQPSLVSLLLAAQVIPTS